MKGVGLALSNNIESHSTYRSYDAVVPRGLPLYGRQMPITYVPSTNSTTLNLPLHCIKRAYKSWQLTQWTKFKRQLQRSIMGRMSTLGIDIDQLRHALLMMTCLLLTSSLAQPADGENARLYTIKDSEA